MKYLPILTLLWCLAAIPVAAQAPYAVETDSKTGKKGLVDPFDGRVILPFEYDQILPIASDSLIVVSKNRKMGALDFQGRAVVPLNYSLLDFTMGRIGGRFEYAAASEVWPGKDKWGLIDRKGKMILPFQFEYVEAILPGLLVARAYRDSVLQFFDARGKPLFTQIGASARRGFDEQSVEIVQPFKGTFFIQKTGQAFLEGRYPDLRWTDGRLLICDPQDKQGLLSTGGDTILPFQYRRIFALGDGNFLVEAVSRWQGIANSEGQFILPLGKQKVQKWRPNPESVYLVRPEGKSRVQLYDLSGKLLASDCYVSQANFALNFPKPLADCDPWKYLNVQLPGNTTGFFHADGRQILPFEFEYVQYCSDRHPLLAGRRHPEDNSKSGWEAYDFTGKKILSGEFRKLAFTNNPRLLLGLDQASRLWGFVSLDAPDKARFDYEQLIGLPSGYFIGKSNAGWQLFDPETQRVKIEKFDYLIAPVRRDFEQFRTKKLPGKLIAVGQRTGADKPFAINEKGRVFPLDPWPVEELAVEETPVLEVAEIVAMPEVEQVIEAPRPVEHVVEAPPPPAKSGDEAVRERVETPAQFPGGKAALREFLTKNLKLPPAAKEARLICQVVLRFIVEKDGSLSSIMVIKDNGAGCGQEAIRVVKAMPNWIPGKQGGRAVRSYFTLPVRIDLE